MTRNDRVKGHTSGMPWLPSTTELVSDRRLDAYRGRVAVLVHAGSLVGHLAVTAEYVAAHRGGWWWWSRWTPFTEVAVVHLHFLDSTHTEVFWLDGPDLDAEIQRWKDGFTNLVHGAVRLRWLLTDQADQAMTEDFQLTLDHHHRTIPQT